MSSCAIKSSGFTKTLESKIAEGKLTTEQAISIDEQVKSQQFKDWFVYDSEIITTDGRGYDNFGYPRLLDNLYIQNIEGQKVTIYDLQNSEGFEKVTKIDKQISEIQDIAKFLKEQAIGLQKRISAYNKTAYADELQDLLDTIDALHENEVSEALGLHTKYILETIKKFETRLYNYQDTNTNNLNEQQLKEREEKYFSFLLQAKQFTETFEKITQLPKPTHRNSKLTSILNQLRHSEARVSDLKKVLENETDRIWSTRLKQMSTNPDIVSGVLDFLAAQEDETGAQRWLDSLADSHHPILATLSKKYRRQMELSRLDSIRLTKEWKKFCEENGLTTDTAFKKFIDKEGKFIEKYNMKGYYTSMMEVRQPLRNLEEQNRKYKADGKTYTKEYKSALANYYKWKKENTISPVKNVKTFKPNEKWVNSDYAKLTSKEVDQLNHIQSFLFDLIKHTNYSKIIDGVTVETPTNIIGEGYIPSFAKTAGTKKAKKEITEENTEKIITEAGEIVRFIPLKFIKKLNQTSLVPITTDMSEEEKKAAQAENDRIKKENKLAHGEALNYNLYETMSTFIQTATNHRRKLEMKLDVDATISQFKHLKIKQRTARGNTMIDKIASRYAGDTVEHEKDAVDSNAYKHLLDWVEGVFYDEFNLDEGALTEWTNKIQNVSSALGIGFNALSAINNKIVGNVQLKIEAAGKQYFTYKELTEARKIYFLNQLNFINERNKDKSSTLTNGLIKFFDVLQSQDELTNKPGNLKESLLHKLRMAKDAAYFMQHIGEHQIQNTALLTLLNSHRVIDGKPTTFFEYIKKYDISADVKKMVEQGKTKEEINTFIKENRKDEKGLREEFEKAPKLIDEFELVDGHAELKEGSPITQEQIADFKHKVIGINQKLHGIYNTEDAAMIQRYALGRLGMQFRKWIPNAWNRRFGSKFGKSFYNERREEFNEGMYVSTFKYIASPFVKNFKEYREQQQSVAKSAFKSIFTGFKDFITNAKINWHTLNSMEKANVRRTALEMLLVIGAVLTGLLLKGGDDDEDKNKLVIWGLYECDRLYGELTTFTPLGVLREGNRLFDNPLASFKTFDNVAKLTWNVMMYPIRDEEERTFKSGIYHGRDKVSVYFTNNVPIVNQIQKLAYLSENNQRYSMFK